MLTLSTLYCYTAHYDCNLLHNMAAPEDKMKDRVSESYVTERSNLFNWVNKWFYSDPTVSEVSDCLLYTAYKFSMIRLIGHSLSFMPSLFKTMLIPER
jgi:hypothetical protein